MRKRLASTMLIVALVSSFASAPGLASAGAGTTLTVTRSGAGTVTSGDGFIDCGQFCSHVYGAGDPVTLTATPAPSSTFVRWKGACTGGGSCQLTIDADTSVRAVFAPSFRPDAWIKLCGLSTGCVIDPPPHPWRGNDVYNQTGRKQTVSVRMEDGEGVRFWIAVQNDGADDDTITIDGCRGTPRFVINAVLVGKQKRPNWRAKNITQGFKDGTAKFRFEGPKAHTLRYFTVNIVAPTTAEGVTYRCPITISSEGDHSAEDTVLAVMTTY